MGVGHGRVQPVQILDRQLRRGSSGHRDCHRQGLAHQLGRGVGRICERVVADDLDPGRLDGLFDIGVRRDRGQFYPNAHRLRTLLGGALSVSSFPTAPHDPFAAALGSRAPASPFRAGDGLAPPLLVGRDRHLAEAAELIRAIREQRPTPIVGFHGPSGIGKTSLLDHIETEVVARGGLVARVDGSDRSSGLVSFASAHQRLRANAPDVTVDSDVADTIAAHYRAASAIAAESDLAFVVLVDNLHAASDLTDQLAGTHDRGVAIVFAGAHDHAKLADMPGGIRSVEVDYLQPGDTVDAIAVPLQDHGLDVDPELIAAAAARSGGFPLAVQAWGDELWRASHEGRLGRVDDLVARVDAQLGRHYSTIWMGLTDTERQYVDVLAKPFGGAMSAGRVADLAGYAASQNASPLRSRLLDRGIIHVPQYGHLEVAIAGLGRWRAAQRAGLTPLDTAAPRASATREQYGLAAEGPVPYRPTSTQKR